MRVWVFVISGLVISHWCFPAESAQQQEKKLKVMDEQHIVDQWKACSGDRSKLLALVQHYPELRQERMIGGLRPVIYQVALEDPAQIPTFLAAGASIDQQGDNGKTALMESTTYGSKKIARSLLENKASIEPVDDAGCDAIMHAFNYGKGGEIVEELIKHSSFPPLVNRTVVLPYTRQSQKSTYLREALKRHDQWYLYRERIVATLLKTGATVEVDDVLVSVGGFEKLYKKLVPYCSQEVLQSARSRIAVECKGRALPKYIQSCEQEIDVALAKFVKK